MGTNIPTLITELVEAGIEFVVVGGVAAVVQGVPVATFDLDIVHKRTEGNVDKIFAVIKKLNGYVRGHGDKKLLPSREGLLGHGHCLLQTDYGPLDILGAIEQGLSYEALVEHCISVTLYKHTVLVLSLGKIAEIKSESKRDKDKLVLRLIQKTMKERAK